MSKSKDDRYLTASAMCAAARAALGSGIPTTPAATSAVAETRVAEQPKSEPAAKPPPPTTAPPPPPARKQTAPAPPAARPSAAPPPAKPPAVQSRPLSDFPAAPARRDGDQPRRGILRPRVIVPVVAIVAIIAVAIGAYAYLARPQSGSDQPQQGARGLVPADDNNGAARVADLLFPAIPTQGADGSPCGYRASDGYNACPLTQRLSTRIRAKPLENSEPLCRCGGVYTSINRSITSTDNGATVHVSVLDQSARSHAIDISIIKTNDGWVASDTTCTDRGGSTSIFAGSPTDCT
jgi:hypothetical protein